MRWTLDPTHAEVEFAVKHLMISTVKGRFKAFTGSGETDPSGKLTSVAMSIDTSSVDTNALQRDEHLRSPDFFDAAKFPALTFRSTAVRQSGPDVSITGDLAIRGTTRPVTLTGEFNGPAQDPWGNSRAALAVHATINRKDWGLGWNMALEAGGLMVSDEVKLRIEVEATAVQETGSGQLGAAA